MKLHKRTIAAFLAIMLSVSIFSACKNEEGTSQSEDSSSTTTQTTQSTDESQSTIETDNTTTTTASTEETTLDSNGTTANTTTTSKDTTTTPQTTVPKPPEGTDISEYTTAQIVAAMNVGWNLGNTLDSTGSWINSKDPTDYEKAWGNPITTKAMIDEIKKAGFNTIRIPTSWGEHVGAAPNYTIEKAWMDRVQEVVDYAYDNEMFIILNFHHEEWHFPSYDNLDKAKAQLTKMWAQVAERFKNYDEHLIFEGMNEPRLKGTEHEWTGGTDEATDVINQLNAAFVDTIRKSAGKNKLRHLMVPTHGASSAPKALKGFKVPDDDRIIVSIHSYSPYNFALNVNGTGTWSTKNKGEIDSLIRTIDNTFLSKGIPVIIGEFGAMTKSNADNLSSRVAWAEYYVKAAKAKGVPCIWWDNGGFTGDGELFGIFNRRTLKWEYPDIVDALMRGVK